MIRKLLVLWATAASVVFCGAFVTSGSQAAAADTVQVKLVAWTIDGSVRITTSSGWSWRCPKPGYSACTLPPITRDTLLTLVGEDGARSRFLRWEGACSSSGADRTCTIPASDNVTTVTAQFSPLRLWLPTFGPGSIVVESARPGVAQPGWRSCGTNCREYANGESLRLRAAPSNSKYRMAGWGGACANVRINSDCFPLTMRSNYIVWATFEEIPPENCPPEKNKICQPAGAAKDFDLHITGRGAVIGKRMGSLPTIQCEVAQSLGRWCTLTGLLRKQVELQAVERYGDRFLGWDGANCPGTGKCRFELRAYGRKTITARFG